MCIRDSRHAAQQVHGNTPSVQPVSYTHLDVYKRQHLATVHSDEELADVLQGSPRSLAFDLDTYRLALKHLLQPGKAGTTLIDFEAIRKNRL